MNKLSRFLVAATALSSLLFAFSQRDLERLFSGSFLTYPMLQPGEKIGDMVITTGVEAAYPLSAFCSPKKENDHSITVDCGETSFCAKFAIGEIFGALDLIPPSLDRKDLTWKMSIDGHPIDLDAFDVYDSVRPDLAPSPFPVREVFKITRLWDVILVNPTPGMHTIQGQAQTRDGAATYMWVIHLPAAEH